MAEAARNYQIRVGPEAVACQGVDIAQAALVSGRDVVVACDVRDAAMAQRDEVLDRGHGAVVVVRDHRRGQQWIGVAIDQHKGDAFGRQRLDGGIVVPRRGEDQPVDEVEHAVARPGLVP